ncbi:MAG TPA: GDSL-type esterase/lipase family protein [Gemmatales bacterium]|nr:GDSL-type esterase/lipase family protein [Gemmatales bacterium]
MLLLSLLCLVPAADLALKDGDRVVMVGGALIEREQLFGRVEVMLHTSFPDKKFTVRNVGWSGDTVWGEARAEFGPQPEGYKKLVEQVKVEKPTVLILAYGTNEAFAGKEKVEKFTEQYRKLLADIVPEGCRTVFLTIPGPKHPKLSPKFAQIEYDAAIKALAKERQGIVVDIYHAFHPYDSRPMSDDGMLPNDLGYEKLATDIAFAIHAEEREQARKQPQVITPVPLNKPVDLEPLRQLILQKNQLYFYKYRPANDTYLYLFRKHEQGNNAAEIPKFDPLIAELDAKINELKKQK